MIRRKRYSTPEELHDLALILCDGVKWRQVGIFYELQLYIILNDKTWITENQARKWLKTQE